MSHRITAKNAFTLIELLVVVAIICLLTAILFPVFARARETARRSACQSNMKQLGLGVIQYCQDYDDRFPFSTDGSADGSKGWAGRINTYVKNVDVFACPSDTNRGRPRISYAINNNLGGYATYFIGTYGVYKSVNQSQMIAPALSVLLLEVTKAPVDVTNPTEMQSASSDGEEFLAGNGNTRFATGMISGCKDYYTLNLGETNNARHFDGANYLAADGHVKWYKPERVSRGRNAHADSMGADGGCSTLDYPAGTGNLGAFQLTFSIY